MSDSAPRLGPYVLLERLRRSAYGYVELAYDTSANRFVALKSLVPRTRTAETALRFGEEVQLWRKLKHGHVLRLLDEGERDGRAWAAGEWLHGVELEKLLEAARNNASLPSTAIAATLTAQISDALSFLNTQAITVQAELAPKNLLVSFEGRAVLVELGNLRFLGRKTSIDVEAALQPWLAPEVRRGETPNARSDVYSLGVLLWFVLTGSPHSGEPENSETKERLRETLRQWRLDVEGELLTALWVALQENPRHRFEGSREMKTALRAAIEGGFAPTEEIGEFVKKLFGAEQARRQYQLAEWRRTYGESEAPEEEVRTAVLDRAPVPRPVSSPPQPSGSVPAPTGSTGSMGVVAVLMLLALLGAAAYFLGF